jgi:sterol desaturase/sphingolipid hydroxylase (fatty acid hydroxylase superfamily)
MPTIVNGTTLVPPRSRRDCVCTFCGLFRAHHYWLRAICTTMLVAPLVLLTASIDGYLRSQRVPPGQVSAVVGVLMIVAAGAAVLALAMWYQPLRRSAHRLRPREQ